MKNNSVKLILLSTFSLFLTACGGGGDSGNTNAPSSPNNNNTNQNIQPRAIETENWQSARLIHTKDHTTSSVEVVGSELIVSINSTDISQGAHLQIYLNTDNKPETGFQFDNEAWEESGVDYLIEDGDLFKSTQNNTGWNWNVNVGAIDYSIDTNNATAKIDLSLLGDICNNLKLGVMTRDEFWDISTFSPASSKMQSYTVSYCNTNTQDTVKPEITLLGANPMKLTVGDTFSDPGATANDNKDGDITSKIIPKSTVITSVAGTYAVTYLVTDLAGNSANIKRTVIVSDIATPDGIVVDGNTSDWNDIPNFSSSADGIMKVSDDEEKLYVLVTSSDLGENIQILMDTDNKESTGLSLSAQITTWVAGADYMVENNSLDKSKSSTGWSWDYGIASIEYIKTADALEIAIKKSDLNLLANKIPMGFVSRTDDWNVVYVIPSQSIPSYTLQFPNVVNPIIANNDSATTANDTAVKINVISNDSSTTGSALTVSVPEQPSSGTARVSQNKVLYTPDSTFTGTMTFAYEVGDINGNKARANIKVIVTEPIVVNLPPVARNDSASTPANKAISVNVLANDTDADGNTLKLESVTAPNNGTAVIVNKRIKYTPKNNFTGSDTFNYVINDGNGATATAKVTIIVSALPNNDPVAKNDSATTIGINTKQIRVLLNDTDLDGDTLEITNFTRPSKGKVTLTTASATFNYTPNATFSGTDTFTYTISDGNGGNDTATVTVTVPPNNDPDANGTSTSIFFNETVSIDVLALATDVDGDELVVDAVFQAAQGLATINPDGTLKFDPQNNVGSFSIGFSISDGRGGSDFDILTVSSTNPNDGNDAWPTISNENVSTPKNTAIFIDVLANDFDADGDTLILDQVNQGQNGTTQKVTRNGVLGVLYTPNPGFTGTNVFYYGVHDGFGHNGSGNVTVTVTP